MAQPVAIRMATMSAPKKGKHDPAAAIIAMPGKGQGVDCAIGVCQRARRVQLANGGKDNINDPQDRFGISANRFRGRCRQQ